MQRQGHQLFVYVKVLLFFLLLGQINQENSVQAVLNVNLCIHEGGTLNHECIVNDPTQGASSTVWQGEAFMCSESINQIALSHSHYESGISGACGNFSAVSVGVSGSEYTSRLTVNVSHEVTINCTLGGVVVVETIFVRVGTSPPPPFGLTVTLLSESSLTVSWSPPSGAVEGGVGGYVFGVTGEGCGCVSMNISSDTTSVTCSGWTAAGQSCSFEVKTLSNDCGLASNPVSSAIRLTESTMSTYWIATEATSRDNTTTLQMRDNTTIITALATVISFLLGLGAVTLIVVCILVYRKKTLVFNQQSHQDPPPAKKNENYSLRQVDNPVYDEASSTQPNYSSQGPSYDMKAENDKMTNGYDYIQQPQGKNSTPQFKAVIRTPEKTDASGNNFYDAEQHTYAVVNANKKKKKLWSSAADNDEYTTDLQDTPTNPKPLRDEDNKKGDNFYDAEEHTYAVVEANKKKKSKKTASYTDDDDQPEANTQNTPPNPTPVRDKDHNEGDDFYDAEEHTYSAVNVKCKKKGNENIAGSGDGEREKNY